MEELIKRLENLKKQLNAYNVQKRVQEILSLDVVRDTIIALIQKRIFEQGQLADGERLITDSARFQTGQKAYSIRNTAKRNFDHVTLFVSGDFFEQWQLNVGLVVSRVSADKIRDVWLNFQDLFTSSSEMMDKLGTLSPDELDLIGKRVVLPYIEADLKAIFKNV